MVCLKRASLWWLLPLFLICTLALTTQALRSPRHAVERALNGSILTLQDSWQKHRKFIVPAAATATTLGIAYRLSKRPAVRQSTLDAWREVQLRVPVLSAPRSHPVTLDDWQAYFDHEGRRTIPVATILESIHTRGIAPQARGAIWPFLLNLYTWETSATDRATLLDHMVSAYRSLEHKREAGVYPQDLHALTLRQIHMDVVRTFTERDGRDRILYHREALTRILHAFLREHDEVKYVQGMNDIAATFMVVLYHADLPVEKEGVAFEALVYHHFVRWMTMYNTFDETETDAFPVHTRATDEMLTILNTMQPAFTSILHHRSQDVKGTLRGLCLDQSMLHLKRQLRTNEATAKVWEHVWTYQPVEEKQLKLRVFNHLPSHLFQLDYFSFVWAAAWLGSAGMKEERGEWGFGGVLRRRLATSDALPDVMDVYEAYRGRASLERHTDALLASAMALRRDYISAVRMQVEGKSRYPAEHPSFASYT